jgi:hypothetical protein
MTRKDYELIANAIETTVQSVNVWPEPLSAMDALTMLGDRLMDDLSDDNPYFDGERFLRAAGLRR